MTWNPSSVRVATFALVITTLLGCAFGEIRPNDPMAHQYRLEETQHEYTLEVRFNDFDKASKFVADEERPLYLANAPEDDVKFTDSTTHPWEINEKLDHAMIKVTYTAYYVDSMYEIEIVELQTWTRERTEWTIISAFEGLRDDIAANATDTN